MRMPGLLSWVGYEVRDWLRDYPGYGVGSVFGLQPHRGLGGSLGFVGGDLSFVYGNMLNQLLGRRLRELGYSPIGGVRGGIQDFRRGFSHLRLPSLRLPTLKLPGMG